MPTEQYHEPPDELSDKTRTFARMMTSLIEEAEAINWYPQRISLEKNRQARAIMENAQKEEFKHFGMDLEFILRQNEKFRETLQGILFKRATSSSTAKKRRSQLTDPSLPTRADTLALMEEYTASDSLRKHMLSVEAVMRAYAQQFGEDEERWGITGLIHDFDYEKFPNSEHSPSEGHPAEGVRILRERGYPEDILQAILGHATYSGVPRDTLMAKTLFAVDELTGLVTATALVRPSRSVREVEAKSVKKKMKDKAFARGVSREDVITGAEELGVPLDDHIAFVIRAMQSVAGEIGSGGIEAELDEGSSGVLSLCYRARIGAINQGERRDR